jgi:hypothetical protein
MTNLEVVEATWKEIGYRIRPLRHTVFIRADKPALKIGEIWMPPKLTDFYSGMPHHALIGATVLSAGPKAEVKPGDRVCFQRLYFARLCVMRDFTLVGWILGPNITGYLNGDVEPRLADTIHVPRVPRLGEAPPTA